MSGVSGPGQVPAGVLSRRKLLGLAGAGAVTLAVPGCGLRATGQAGVLLRSRLPLPEPFTVPLPVPAVAQPAGAQGTGAQRTGAQGTRAQRTGAQGIGTSYQLAQRPAEVEIIPGTRTEVWGYDGTFPGPTFDVRSRQPISVAITNELPVPTSTHLHGGVTAPRFDGYPTHLVVAEDLAGDFEPGVGSHVGADSQAWKVATGRFVHEYGLDQPAATLWYHDHRMDFTGPQLYRGLAGMFVIRDDVEDALPLPGGDKDIPLLICDRAFEEDGAFRYPSVDPTLLGEPGVEGAYHQGVEGDVILVNGAPWPELEVDATRYRFRVLNASNARRYDLRLDPPPPDGTPFTQVGSDIGLLGAPQGLDRVALAPAERADVVIDFGAYPVGTRITLVNQVATGSVGQVMRFRITRRGREAGHIPGRLADVERLTPRQAVARRHFDFRLSGPGEHGTMWTINGEIFDPAQALAAPQLGTTELWTFTSDFHHPVHIHLGHFQVYRRNGRSPGPADAGWKDTVDVHPYEVVEVLVRFTGHRGRYVFHCHNLEHEDMAMMANFDVV